MCLQALNKAAAVVAASGTELDMAPAPVAVREQAAAVEAAAVKVQDTAAVSAMASAPALRAIPRYLRA